MLTLLQLLLPEVAAQHRVAMSIDSVAEVLAGDADLRGEAPGQSPVIHKIPLIHASPFKYVCTHASPLVLATPLEVCCGRVTGSPSSPLLNSLVRLGS